MSQFVDIPVKCISEECRHCAELDIDTERTVYDDGVHEFLNNICFCKHYRRCEQIMEHLRKNHTDDNEKDGV